MSKSRTAWNKGKKMSLEFCEKVSKAKMGKSLSLEHRISISTQMKGKIPKNFEEFQRKGQQAVLGSKHTEETKKKMSNNQKNRTRKPFSEKQKTHLKIMHKKAQKANKGSYRTEEQKQNISNSRKGFKMSDEQKIKLSISQKGKIISEEIKQKQSKGAKRYWENASREKREIHIKNLYNGSGSSPNNLEKGVDELLKQLNANYELTGNGKLFIGSYCPDFVNEFNKKVIEVYGDYWHCNPNKYESNYFNNNCRLTAKEIWQRDAERIKTFKQYGYDTLIIWESEFRKNKSFIEQKIKDFDKIEKSL